MLTLIRTFHAYTHRDKFKLECNINVSQPNDHRSHLLVSSGFYFPNLLSFVMYWVILQSLSLYFSCLIGAPWSKFPSSSLIPHIAPYSTLTRPLGSYINLHGSSKLTIHDFVSDFWALKFTDSNNSGHESYGNGKWSRGCTNGWKGSKIRRPPIPIYSGTFSWWYNGHHHSDCIIGSWIS